jgi:hypothetical protein
MRGAIGNRGPRVPFAPSFKYPGSGFGGTAESSGNPARVTARVGGRCGAPVCVEPDGREFRAGETVVFVGGRRWHPLCEQNHRRLTPPPAPAPPPSLAAAPIPAAQLPIESWVKVEMQITTERGSATVAISEKFAGSPPGDSTISALRERARDLAETDWL